MRRNLNKLLLLISFILPILTIFILHDDIIPMHFNSLGKIDRYGNKIELLIMPIFFVVLFLIIKMIKHYVAKDNYLLFDFISFELLLFLDFLFVIVCLNLFLVVNLKYDKFVVDIFYSYSWFLSYLILHLGIKIKKLSITIGYQKISLLSFFNLSIFMFLFSILINLLFINKSISFFIIMVIYVLSVLVYFIFIAKISRN